MESVLLLGENRVWNTLLPSTIFEIISAESALPYDKGVGIPCAFGSAPKAADYYGALIYSHELPDFLSHKRRNPGGTVLKNGFMRCQPDAPMC
jgi:hypothetical protein